MSTQFLKAEFLTYLAAKNGAVGQESAPKYNTEAGDLCITLYASEFKEFLSSSHYADASVLSKSIGEILSMDFENGRLVDKDEETSDTFESESQDEQESDPASQLTQESMLDFISAVDSGAMPAPASVPEPAAMGMKTIPTDTASTANSADSTSVSGAENATQSQSETPSSVVNNNSEPATATDSQPESTTYPEDVQSKLDEIYNSPEALEYLDIDGSGDISDAEKLLFEKFVQGDNKELTAEDLQKALDSIKNGDFEYDPLSVKFDDVPTSPTDATKPTEATQPTDPTQDTMEQMQQMMQQMQQMMQQMQQMQQNQQSSSGFSPSSSTSSSRTSANSNKNSDELDKKPLDKMTEQELEIEKATAEGKLSDQQTTLNDIFDDDKGPLSKQKSDMDAMYTEYQTALKEVAPELAEQLDSIVGQISEQEGAIDKQEVAVSEQEVAVSSSKNSLDNAKATQSQAQTSLDELNAVDQSELDDEQKAALQEKIDAANAELENANAAVTKAEQTYNAAQEALQMQTEALDKMKGEEGLASLQAQKDALDKQIAEQHPEIADKQKNYNDAKKDYDKQKSEMISTAKSDILKAQDYINEINTAINNVENKQLKKDLSFSKNGEIFGSNIDKSAEYVQKDGQMPYMVIGPKNPDPNKEYPVVVYLHGDYQTGGGKALMDETMPGMFMNGELPEDFDGYIICPQLDGEFYCGGDWQNEQAEAGLRGVIDDFSQSHNVDKDKIALTGGSRGAMGVEYMAKNMSDIFCKAAAISSFPSGVDISDIPIPILGLVGSGDRGDSQSYMQSVYEQLIWLDATHDTSPYEAFKYDSDGNGRSDLYEWLFSE